MPPVTALVRISSKYVLPIRVFINRREILNKIVAGGPVSEAALKTNNVIVRLRRASLRIFLSDNDCRSLCLDLRDDLLFLLCELASLRVCNELLKKLKIGESIEFLTLLKKLKELNGLSGDFSNLELAVDTVWRLDSGRYKFHFKKKWEADIIVTDIRKLIQCRQTLMLNNAHIPPQGGIGIMLREQVTKETVMIPDEDDACTPSQLPNKPFEELETKPELIYKYNRVLSLGGGIEVHVLQRPPLNRKT